MPSRLFSTDDLKAALRNTKGIIAYNHTKKRFEIKETTFEEGQLQSAIDDGRLPEKFVTFLEQNLDPNEMVYRGVDAGGF